MSELKIGVIGEAKVVTSEENSAIKLGSGSVLVFATPAMVALMENAAMNSVQKYLPEGSTTVGTLVEINHLSATPLGVQVSAKSELIEMDGKKLVFRVEAFDNKDKIGEGTHHRFVIDIPKFMGRVEAKKE